MVTQCDKNCTSILTSIAHRALDPGSAQTLDGETRVDMMCPGRAGGGSIYQSGDPSTETGVVVHPHPHPHPHRRLTLCACVCGILAFCYWAVGTAAVRTLRVPVSPRCNGLADPMVCAKLYVDDPGCTVIGPSCPGTCRSSCSPAATAATNTISSAGSNASLRRALHIYGDSTMRRLFVAICRSLCPIPPPPWYSVLLTKTVKLTSGWSPILSDPTVQPPSSCNPKRAIAFSDGAVYDHKIPFGSMEPNTVHVIAPTWWIAPCFGRFRESDSYVFSLNDEHEVDGTNNPEPGIFTDCRADLKWVLTTARRNMSLYSAIWEQPNQTQISSREWLPLTYVAMYVEACHTNRTVIISTPPVAAVGKYHYTVYNHQIVHWVLKGHHFRLRLQRLMPCSNVHFIEQTSYMGDPPGSTTRAARFGSDNSHGIHTENEGGMAERVDFWLHALRPFVSLDVIGR